MTDVADPAPAIHIQDPDLHPIMERVLDGRRLSLEDGEVLYRTPDIHGLCRLADVVRRRLHGRVAYYNINRHINYSNVCALSCSFCAFHRKRGQEGAYEMTIEEVKDAALAAATRSKCERASS